MEAAWWRWVSGKPEFDNPPRRQHDAGQHMFLAARDFYAKHFEQRILELEQATRSDEIVKRQMQAVITDQCERTIRAEARVRELQGALKVIERNRDGHDAVRCVSYPCAACIARVALTPDASEESHDG
jgi:hypothetical protein